MLNESYGKSSLRPRNDSTGSEYGPEAQRYKYFNQLQGSIKAEALRAEDFKRDSLS